VAYAGYIIAVLPFGLTIYDLHDGEENWQRIIEEKQATGWAPVVAPVGTFITGALTDAGTGINNSVDFIIACILRCGCRRPF
jgi:hypothetical protein